MGVDFTLLKGYGFLFPLSALSESQRTTITDLLDETDVQFAGQDYYGSYGQDFMAYGFVYWEPNVEEVFDGKIGHTPYSLMLHGVYQENDYIKGGAVRPFAITCKEEREDMSEVEQAYKTEILNIIREEDEDVAKVIEENGVYAQWLYSYFS